MTSCSLSLNFTMQTIHSHLSHGAALLHFLSFFY